MNAHSEKMNEESVADVVVEIREESARADLEQNYTLDDAAESMREFAARIEAAWKREKAEWEAAACAFVSDAVMSGRVAVEHAPVGNIAVMREALEDLVNHHCRNCPEDTQYGCGVNIGGLLGFKCTLLRKARAALAAPPRNCDVGSAEEHAERYGRYCDKFTSDGMHCETCPCCGKIPYGKCEFAWAQMPYEAKEGGAR